MKNKGELLGLGVAALLWGGGLATKVARSVSIDGSRPAVYFPAALLLLAGVNHRLRSKVLSWGVFTAAFLLAMIVFGTWAVAARTQAAPLTLNFLATTVLYAALAVSALFQLRRREEHS